MGLDRDAIFRFRARGRAEGVNMTEKAKYVLEERPESDVYVTDSGFIGIRQVVRGEETVVLFTADEAVKIVGYLQKCVEQLGRKKS